MSATVTALDGNHTLPGLVLLRRAPLILTAQATRSVYSVWSPVGWSLAMEQAAAPYVATLTLQPQPAPVGKPSWPVVQLFWEGQPA